MYRELQQLGLQPSHQALQQEAPQAQTTSGDADLWVQSSINLIKKVKGRWVTSLNSKDECQSHQSLLPS